jgi:hypothetical protein
MASKFMIGDKVIVANDEGLDVPTEAQGKIGVITGYLRDKDTGDIVEWWVTGLDFAKFNATSYHITKVED